MTFCYGVISLFVSQLLTRLRVGVAGLFVEHLGIEPFSFSISVDRAETTEGLASRRELINNAYNQVGVIFFSNKSALIIESNLLFGKDLPPVVFSCDRKPSMFEFRAACLTE